jgi:hypothetical protein
VVSEDDQGKRCCDEEEHDGGEDLLAVLPLPRPLRTPPKEETYAR